MNNAEFVLWLLGYLEICFEDELNIKKMRIIRNHINLVKAVDGQLNQTNQEIYDILSSAIKNETDVAGIKNTLHTLIADVLHKNFPEGHYEEVLLTPR